ncbi:hypothetical protein L9F63_005368 [Diploptera punctata]|uniref:NADH dehydrogenase [ubiquinone] 1 subunit C2 n=1 Tax=Diploptera punctata TaxID=6984 RepID=A0AAD8E5V2_DIPPU|nr:hypothetical protein L9F63_005368 [Diploptera punctata]
MSGKTNMELLTRDPDRIDPFLSKWWNPLAATVVGVVTVVFMKYGTRRPLLSGVQQYAIGAGLGGGLGYYIDQKRNRNLAERDAILRHYLEMHPEDFPEPERKKYADVLNPWVPIR